MPLRKHRGKILLATRNETTTVPLVLEEIAEIVHKLEQVGWNLDVEIIDDSDDSCLEPIIEHESSRLNLDIQISRGPNRGLGAAIITGFEICLNDPEIEFIVNLDADGQHDARQLSDLLRIFAATEAGITIGSRWTNGGRCYGLTKSRKIVSRISSLALRMAGVPKHIKDPTTSFRVYRRDTAEKLVREILGFNGFSFFGAGIATASAYGILVNETPIHFRPRVTGKSNLSFSQTLSAIQDLPKIRSHSSMIRRRERAFQRVVSNPEKYTASRELELLSNTPKSTEIIMNELSSSIGETVLEVGAGLGLITSHLIRKGISVTAIEPDSKLFQKLENNLSTVEAYKFNGTLDTWSKELEKKPLFQTVLYINVLEHIANDVEELRLASTFCESNGKIVIFVPAGPTLYGSMDWISAHFRRYRRDELEAIALKANLRVDSIRYFDSVGKIPYWLMYRVLRKSTIGTASVGIYDKAIVPLSTKLPQFLVKLVGGKNLILVCSPN